MRCVLLSIFIISWLVCFWPLNSLQAQSWEWNNPRPNGIDINDIQFLDSLNGIAVGDFGKIYRTEDGGNKWETLDVDISSTLTSLHFVDEEFGWAVGTNGIILRTRNGGRSWDIQALDEDMFWTDVFFIDRLSGWVVGKEGFILYTKNGGLDWLTSQSTAVSDFNGVHFANDSVGWAVGTNGIISRTKDGGQLWEVKANFRNTNLKDIHLVGQDSGYIMATSGSLLSIVDRDTIAIKEIEHPISGPSAGFNDSGEGLIYGLYRDGIIRLNADTVDLSVEVVAESKLNNIFFLNDKKGWIVGENGQILFTTDGGLNWQSKEDDFRTVINDVDFISKDTGWICGNAGNIYKTINGGKQWGQQNTPVRATYEGIQFINENIGYAISRSPAGIIKTTNGGANWIRLNVPDISSQFYDLHFVDENIGWIVGTRAGILKTENGGESWEVVNRDGGFWLLSIFFVDNQHGWLVGGNGLVFKTTDGGEAWSPITVNDMPRSFFSRDVFFIDQNIGWISGDNGLIFHTKDGGNSWIRQSANTNVPLHKIIFKNNLCGWVVGSSGTILSTNDGGSTWETQAIESGQALNSIGFAGNSNIWAVGGGGNIFTFDESNIPLPCHIRDSIALRTLYEQTNGDNWSRIRWNINEPFSRWLFAGDINEEGCVTRLSLIDNNMEGILPEAIGELKDLRILSLSGNKLSGELPDSLYQLTNLRLLNLRENELEGIISPEIDNLIHLESLNLSLNKLSGPIPPSLRILVNLDNLNLSFNQLEGPIGATISRLTDLEVLFLQHNQLRDTISSAFLSLQKIIELNLSHNAFYGDILMDWSGLQNLVNLDLGNNELEGALPESLSRLPSMDKMKLDSNGLGNCYPVNYQKARWAVPLGYDFRGNAQLPNFENFLREGVGSCCRLRDSTIMVDLYDQTDGSNWTLPWPVNQEVLFNEWSGIQLDGSGCLESLQLSDFNLSGLLPESFDELANLQMLDLSYNQLGGAIPLSSAGLEQLEYADFSNNNFETLSIVGPSKKALSTLLVDHNNLFFEDIEPNRAVFEVLSEFSPQKIPSDTPAEFLFTPCDDAVLSLSFPQLPTGLATRWYKNRRLVAEGEREGNEVFLSLNKEMSFEEYAGTYQFQLRDTASTLELDFVPNIEVAIPENAIEYIPFGVDTTYCEGELIQIGDEAFDQNRTTACVYVKNRTGLVDTVYEVDLQFFAISQTLIDTTICWGESIRVGGRQFSCLTSNDRVQREMIALTNANRCDSIIQISLRCGCEQRDVNPTPSAFSPNGDQVNDQFVIPYLIENDITGLSARLFISNRNGQVIYQNNDYQNDWEGRDFRGNPVAEGTYYYRLELSNGALVRGIITLVR